MEMIELKNISKSYSEGNGVNKVLKNINLNIQKEEFVAILGKSGSGKSTLLNIIGGLDTPDSGDILIEQKKLDATTDKELSSYRGETVGFVFQSFQLIPVLNVWENVVLPIKLAKKNIDKKYIDELLQLLEIQEKRDSFPTKLSGGQQQRVAIARALANKPRIILADEPTGNLDSETGEKVLELLMGSIRKYKQTLVMITHNEEIARKADRILYMKDGQISADYN
ncbi:MAG: ABC transporter ATP-binding protein [Lachnospiraceae bacterium]|nr:ABC transporter ATP-binding protein [Lachnospiraceae bacterium]